MSNVVSIHKWKIEKQYSQASYALDLSLDENFSKKRGGDVRRKMIKGYIELLSNEKCLRDK